MSLQQTSQNVVSLASAMSDYQSLVDLQNHQPTKKRAVEIRKALMVIKRAVDTERKALLPPKVPKVFTNKSSLLPVEEMPEAPPPLVREITVSVSNPVKEVKIKKKRKTVKA